MRAGLPIREDRTLIWHLERAAEAPPRPTSGDGAGPPDGLCFRDREERGTHLSWGQIRDRARRAGGAIQAAGVQPGDRVLLLFPTGPAFFDAFFGAMYAGAIPVPAYPPVRLGRMDEYVLRTAGLLHGVGAAAILTERRIGRVIGQVQARYAPPRGVLYGEDLLSSPALAPPNTGADDTGMIQFSSGSTVDPKPVALSHRQLLAQTAALVGMITATVRDEQPTGLSWLPLYHDMGLIGCVFPALCHPSRLTLIPPELFLARPALWLRAVSQERAHVCAAPSFAYALCNERITDADMEGCDLSSWKMALNGAEPIHARAARAFAARFARWGLPASAMTPVYGLSEAALAVCFGDLQAPFRSPRFDRAKLLEGRAVPAPDPAAREQAPDPATLDPAPPDPATIELVSVGPPLPRFQVEIRDRGGQPLPEGWIGRIYASGPSIMSGYFGRADQPIQGGWLDTGDLGFLHAGELYITGRARDLIILRGRNHPPQEIEQALDSVDGVRTGCAAAVAQITPEGERLLVFAEIRADRPGLEDDCRRAVRAATGLDPDQLLLLAPGTLPRTSSGKIRRAETLRLHQLGRLLPPAEVNTLHVAKLLAQSVAGKAGFKL